MNTNPATGDAPFVPEGAPPRPVWSHFPLLFLLYNIPLVLGFQIVNHLFNLTTALVVCAIWLSLVCWHLWLLRSHYDRVGWYEFKPIEIPELPFDAGHGVTFTQNGVLTRKFHFISVERPLVSYEAINRVETLCRGIYLQGVQLGLNDGSMIRIFNEYSTGEPARTTLKILHQRAPHAHFCGPPWVAEGWVPRFGFTYPSTD